MPQNSAEKWYRLDNIRNYSGVGPSKESLIRSRLITIGELARHTGATPRAIRHYERLGLIKTPVRTDANYRLFDGDSVARAKFIVKCRSLGFSIPKIAEYLQIMDDPDHTCSQVTELTQEHLDMVDAKIRHLAEMRQMLARNLACCTGKEVPECPVLDFLQESA